MLALERDREEEDAGRRWEEGELETKKNPEDEVVETDCSAGPQLSHPCWPLHHPSTILTILYE